MRLRRVPPIAASQAWAVRAVLSARAQLRRGASELALPPPPRADPHDTRWVRLVVRAAPVTCLARATVLQRWYLALGQRRDVVVAVTPPAAGFKAHAWLDGDPHPSGFVELTRKRPAPD